MKLFHLIRVNNEAGGLLISLGASICLKNYFKELYMEHSGSVVECLTQDRGFEPHQRHCIVVLEQDTFILA